MGGAGARITIFMILMWTFVENVQKHLIQQSNICLMLQLKKIGIIFTGTEDIKFIFLLLFLHVEIKSFCVCLFVLCEMWTKEM